MLAVVVACVCLCVVGFLEGQMDGKMCEDGGVVTLIQIRSKINIHCHWKQLSFESFCASSRIPLVFVLYNEK